MPLNKRNQTIFSLRENVTVKRIVVAKNISSGAIFEIPVVTSVEQMWENFLLWEEILFYQSYLPTPPLRQDMTLGQFLSGV